MNDLIEEVKQLTIKMEENKETRQEVYSLLMRCMVELMTIRNKQISDSWKDNPDRMGGQFTDEEINRNGWQ